MLKKEISVAALCVILIALAGCAAVYRTSDVVAGAAGDSRVRVVPMTAETVIQANRAPYTPASLPAVFSMTAGSGSGLRTGGPLPDPVFEAEPRPAALPLRAPPAADPGPYRIGIGDVVLLSTSTSGSTLEELSGLLAAQNARQGYTVQDDGAVNIPNLGRVRIAGLTIEAAEAQVFNRLVENQFDPTFSLEIAEFNSRKVSVGGAVATPAVLPVALTPLVLGDALAAAGGITVADLDFASVRIYRDGTLYQIPLTTLYARGDLLRTRLVDGDAVFVDTTYALDQAQNYFTQQITLAGARQAARQTALAELQSQVALRRAELQETRENFQARTALGAETRDFVYLAGEVGTQSRFPLPYGGRAMLADAIFGGAGGISGETGDISQIYVLRAATDPREFGAVTAWHLDARNAANFVLSAQFELRPADIVFVAQQPITKWNRAIAQLLPSLINASNVANE